MIYRRTGKTSVSIILIIFLITCSFSAYSNSIKNKTKYNIVSLDSRNILGENDEGPHYNTIYDNEEWWYYNVIFNDPNSDLKNWSVATSLGIFPEIYSLELTIHDDNNNSYGGICPCPKGTSKIVGPGENISFNNSYCKGIYPEWNVYTETVLRDKTEITANLTFKANSKPIWILANTGQNNTKNKFGYYCIMNCIASGEITINKTIYAVKGLGYHDHCWAPLSKKEKNTPNLQKTKENPKKFLDFNVWDWLGIHFDNGWDMFLGKIHSPKNSIFSNLMPGSICITPDGKNIMECLFFKMDYQEFQPSSIPSINIPTKIHIKAIILRITKPCELNPPIILDIYYKTKNVREYLEGSPPDWGQWETTGQVYGKIKSLTKTIDLNGWAIMEITHNINN